MNLTLYERIADLPVEQRPREKLAKVGAEALSDIDLLSLILGSGNGRAGVGRLAQDLLKVLDSPSQAPDTHQLTAIPGIGPARAAAIAAALEFARRRLRPSRKRIGKPADILPMVLHWADRQQEHFLALSLNGAHEVTRLRVVSRGTLDRTIVHLFYGIYPTTLDM